MGVELGVGVEELGQESAPGALDLGDEDQRLTHLDRVLEALAHQGRVVERVSDVAAAADEAAGLGGGTGGDLRGDAAPRPRGSGCGAVHCPGSGHRSGARIRVSGRLWAARLSPRS